MAGAATPPGHRSGFVALVGRPNAGKSTLINRILGQKIAIVSDKPQTTRTRILGIKTSPEAQILLVDTPGIHAARDTLNKRMVAVAEQALLGADIVLWIIDASRGAAALDGQILRLISSARARCCVALNKIDAITKQDLLPLMSQIATALPTSDVVPISALDGENVDRLLEVLRDALPEGPRHYDEDEITDQSERTLAQEIIREKVLEQTRHEVPYSTAITIDAFEEPPEGKDIAIIHATINVARDSQKGIIIGRGGSRLKSIGKEARLEIERVLDRRVYLELFVRVQEEWNTDLRRIREFGL